MPTKLNRQAFQSLIDGNLEWLLRQPRTLERDHIAHIVRDCPAFYYPPNGVDPPDLKPDWFDKVAEMISESLEEIEGEAEQAAQRAQDPDAGEHERCRLIADILREQAIGMPF